MRRIFSNLVSGPGQTTLHWDPIIYTLDFIYFQRIYFVIVQIYCFHLDIDCTTNLSRSNSISNCTSRFTSIINKREFKL